MVIPLIIAGAAVGSGILQWMSSEEARKASAAERKKMQELLNKVQEPNFDMSQINPEEFKVLQKYTPQVSDFVEEARPDLVKGDSADAKKGREAQLQALDRYKQLSQTGSDEYSKILNQEALRAAQIQNQGQQQAILQNMARRGGAAGSGLELQALLGSQQANAANASNSVMDAAKQAYLTRLDALKNSAALGGDIRNQEISQEEFNTNAINAFNARNAAARNNYNRNRDSTYNDAQRYNIDAAQNIADRNIQARNDAARYNQSYGNQLKQNQFNNAMSKTGAQNQIGQQNIMAAYQAAQDRNNAISGVAQGIGQGAMYYGNQQDRAADRAARYPAGNQQVNVGDPYEYDQYGRRKVYT